MRHFWSLHFDCWIIYDVYCQDRMWAPASMHQFVEIYQTGKHIILFCLCLVVITLWAKTLRGSTVTTLKSWASTNLLGVNATADTVGHLDVQLWKGISLICGGFRHVSDSCLLNDVLDQETLDRFVLRKSNLRTGISFWTQNWHDASCNQIVIGDNNVIEWSQS